jgi:hypothetical protein
MTLKILPHGPADLAGVPVGVGYHPPPTTRPP